MNLFIKLKTTLALGVVNVLRVAAYRIGLKSGLAGVVKIEGFFLKGAFFKEQDYTLEQRYSSTSFWVDKRTYFSFHIEADSSIPDWHSNSLFDTSSLSQRTPWSAISDFDPNVGDIKLIWEASRFDWLVTFSQQATTDRRYVEKINLWMSDWCEKNPPYLGVNWKCGQEASIRVLNIALASIILGQKHQPEPALVRFLEVHLKRILPTISYAVAQSNNHGTSEAAALFIGGTWLDSLGIKSGQRYMRFGRKWLENRSRKLIMNDGTFSQYSINYHRLMLDTYSLVERWRTRYEQPSFSDEMIGRLKLATNWLFQFTSEVNGDTPNLGANDGALLLSLGGSDYRDFRPSIQLASVLFDQMTAYPGSGNYDAPLHWLDIAKPVEQRSAPQTCAFEYGGYQLLRKADNFVTLNTQQFRFRPSQSDVLHVDFWFQGECVLCDGGTYSYNSDPLIEQYFSGVKSHNTVEFDGRDQMPKLSRFLFGEWLKVGIVKAASSFANLAHAEAEYKDYMGVSHKRAVYVRESSIEVLDSISGFDGSAVLRWRLASDGWVIDQVTQSISNGKFSIKITSSDKPIRFEIVEGWKSLYYQDKQLISVLEVEVSTSGWIKTEIGQI